MIPNYQPPQPNQPLHPPMPPGMTGRRTVNPLGIAGLATAAFGLLIAGVGMCLGFIAMPIAIIGLCLGIAGLIVAIANKRWEMYMSIAAIGLGLIAAGVAHWQNHRLATAVSKGLNDTGDALNKMGKAIAEQNNNALQQSEFAPTSIYMLTSFNFDPARSALTDIPLGVRRLDNRKIMLTGTVVASGVANGATNGGANGATNGGANGATNGAATPDSTTTATVPPTFDLAARTKPLGNEAFKPNQFIRCQLGTGTTMPTIGAQVKVSGTLHINPTRNGGVVESIYLMNVDVLE